MNYELYSSIILLKINPTIYISLHFFRQSRGPPHTAHWVLPEHVIPGPLQTFIKKSGMVEDVQGPCIVVQCLFYQLWTILPISIPSKGSHQKREDLGKNVFQSYGKRYLPPPSPYFRRNVHRFEIQKMCFKPIDRTFKMAEMTGLHSTFTGQQHFLALFSLKPNICKYVASESQYFSCLIHKW